MFSKRNSRFIFEVSKVFLKLGEISYHLASHWGNHWVYVLFSQLLNYLSHYLRFLEWVLLQIPRGICFLCLLLRVYLTLRIRCLRNYFRRPELSPYWTCIIIRSTSCSSLSAYWASKSKRKSRLTLG